MVKYICNGCDKIYDHKGGYDRHKNKKNPCVPIVNNNINIIKKEDIIIEYLPNVQNLAIIETETHKDLKCKYCHNIFSTSSGYHKHVKICTDREKEVIKIINENESLKKEIEVLKAQYIKDKEEYIKEKTEEIQYLKTLVNGAHNVIKSSFNSLAYVTANYNNAPVLLPIMDKTIVTGNDDTKFINDVMYNFNNGILDRFIGNIVVAQYKKLDPKDQSLWNSDVSRLTYIVKTFIDDKEDWFVDKRGIRLKAKIIEPLLNQYVRPLMLKSIMDKKDEIQNFKDGDKLEDILDQMKISNLIIKLIDESILADDVVRYIASHFYLQKKDDIKLIEK